MNNKLLYTYTLVKTLHEQGKDYIDTFYPFVLKVLPTDKSSLNLASVQEKIKEDWELNIPEHSLKSIINRAKRRGYVAVEQRQTRLSEKGVEYLDRLEPEKNVNRRINELLEDIKIYLNIPQLSLKEVYEVLLHFINENIESVAEFFDPSGVHRLSVPQVKIQKLGPKIVQYFELVEKQKPGPWETLRDIVYGSVISTSIMSSNIAEINKKFKDFQVFLDSNFIFSLFEFHFPEINKPAKELFKLLKIYKFELKVFDFTIDEIVNVLSNYYKERHIYVSGIKVNSIYSNLKSKGWTNEDVREFIQKIEVRIWNLGIKIERSNIDFKTYKPRKEYVDSILKYKPLQFHQTERVRYLDLAAIEKVKEIRNSPKREIERSKAIFLTSDLKLSRFDFLELDHKEKATVCEVIPDRLLTNLLWLKNPTIVKDIPLKSIIAIHSREIFIDVKIWRRFYENIRKLKEEGHIENKDISMLFYNKHIEEVLSGLDELDADKITSEFILEEIKKTSDTIDIGIEKKLKDQESIFEEKIAKKVLDKEKEWGNKIKKIKEKIKTDSDKKASICANCLIWGIISIMAFIVLIFTQWVIRNWNTTQPYTWAIAFFISLISISGLRISLGKIKMQLQSKIYKNNLSKFESLE